MEPLQIRRSQHIPLPSPRRLERSVGRLTDAAWEGLFIVDIALYPSHQVLDILGSRHFRRSLEVFCILPEVLKSESISCNSCWTQRDLLELYILVCSFHLGT